MSDSAASHTVSIFRRSVAVFQLSQKWVGDNSEDKFTEFTESQKPQNAPESLGFMSPRSFFTVLLHSGVQTNQGFPLKSVFDTKFVVILTSTHFVGDNWTSTETMLSLQKYW